MYKVFIDLYKNNKLILNFATSEDLSPEQLRPFIEKSAKKIYAYPVSKSVKIITSRKEYAVQSLYTLPDDTVLTITIVYGIIKSTSRNLLLKYSRAPASVEILEAIEDIEFANDSDEPDIDIYIISEVNGDTVIPLTFIEVAKNYLPQSLKESENNLYILDDSTYKITMFTKGVPC